MGSPTKSPPHSPKQKTTSPSDETQATTSRAKDTAAASTCSAGENQEKQKKSHERNLYNDQSGDTKKTEERRETEIGECESVPTSTVSPQSEQNPFDTNLSTVKEKNNLLRTTTLQKTATSTLEETSQELAYLPYNIQMRQVTDDNDALKNNRTISKTDQQIDTSKEKDPPNNLDSVLKVKNHMSISSKTRIHELLSHRRLLLDGIRQCRIASCERMKSKGADSSDEVEEFRKMTRVALQVIKRPQGQEKTLSTIQQRGAISLRKGASVGKKMAAAVSTLNNSGGWISDSSSSTSPIQTQSAASSNGSSPPPPLKDNIVNSGKRDISLSISNNTGKLPTQTAVNIPTNKLEAKFPSGKVLSNPTSAFVETTDKSSNKGIIPQPNTFVQTPSLPLTNAISSKINEAPPLLQPNKISSSTQPTQKMKRANSFKNIQYNQNLGNPSVESTYSSNTCNPLHLGQSGGEPFLNPLYPGHKIKSEEKIQENEQLKIYHAEVNKLLKKRKSLQVELTARYHKRRMTKMRKKDMQTPQSNKSRKKSLGKNLSQIPSTKEQENTNSFSNEFHKLEQKPLPCRRKTHWDYVLEEMRWMATDFIEERKWKAATGRTLASAVQSHFRVTKTSPGRSPFKPSGQEKCTVHRNDINEKEASPNIFVEKTEWNKNPLNKFSFEDASLEDTNSKMYSEPTIEEIRSAKSISKLMNLMVLTHINSVSNTQIYDATATDSSNDELLSRAHHRFHQVKEKICFSAMNSTKAFELDTYESSATKSLSSDNHSPELTSEIESDDKSNLLIQSHYTRGQCEELSHAEITLRLNKLDAEMNKVQEKLDMIDDAKSIDPDDNDSMKSSITLQPNQKKCVKFFEDLWESDNRTDDSIPGAILVGPFGSGKTISVGALLWKRRFLGLQIVLCPSASVIRWRHELRRFVGLHVLTFGRYGWYFDNNSPKLKSQAFLRQNCNVIICEFSSFETLCDKYSPGWKKILDRKETITEESNTMSFATTVLDARCLSAPTLTAYINGKGNGTNDRADRLSYLPPELIDDSWWHNFHSVLSLGNSKRLLVETCGYVKSKTSPHDYDNLGIENHQRTQILAVKSAFLNHHLFYSRHLTHLANASKWASKSCLDTSNQKSHESIDLFLIKSIVSQTYLIEGSFFATHKKQTDVPLTQWQIKLCPLPCHQRKLYDESCMHLRAMLTSLGERKADINKSVDNGLLNTDCRSLLRSTRALLRLRRLCFCSNIYELLSFPKKDLRRKEGNKKRRKSNDETSSFFKLICGSPSQPNIDFALRVLDKSAKLRELLRILTDTCGYNNHFKHPSLNPKTHGDKQEQNLNKKKVLILATLPEAQVLISTFLNSVGIAHELLLPLSFFHTNQKANEYSFDKTSSACSYSIIKQNTSDKTNSLPKSFLTSWIESQQAIARFCEKKLDNINELIATDTHHIIVSSPTYFDSSSGGLIASSADIVISLDEDWSGRGDPLLYSIASKIMLQNHSSAKSCTTFIKLISEGTCEEMFFATDSSDTKQKQTISTVPITLDNRIHTDSAKNNTKKDNADPILQELSISNSMIEKVLNAVVLGQSIFRFHNLPLNSILQTNEFFPDDLRSGRQPKFLSSCHKNIKEKCSNDGIHELKYQAESSRYALSNYARVFGIILAQVEQSYSWIDIKIGVNDQIFFKESIGDTQKDSLSSLKSSIFFVAIPPVFPKMTTSRRDISSRPIQTFIERLKGEQCPSNSIQINAPMKEQKLCNLSTTEILPEGEAENSEISDIDFGASWYFRGFGDKPEHLALSFLHYSESLQKKNVNISLKSSDQLNVDINSQKVSMSDEKNCESKTCKMVERNRYAHMFSSLDSNCGSSLQDGNQGRESIVYFPPLFPGMLSTYYNTSLDSNEWVDAMNETIRKSAKRKDSYDEPTQSNKRVCQPTPTEDNDNAVSNDSNLLSLDFENITDTTNNMTDDDLANAFMSSHAEVEAMCADLPNMETSDILFSSPLLDTSTPTKDITEDPLLLDSNLPMDMKDSTDKIERTNDDHEARKDCHSDLSDNTTHGDFGLLGCGILPEKHESCRIALRKSVRIQSHSMSYFDSIPINTYSFADSEESNFLLNESYQGSSLNSMIVFVKYEPKGLLLQETYSRVNPAVPYVATNITKSLIPAVPSSDSFRPIVPASTHLSTNSASEIISMDLSTTGSRKIVGKKQKKIQDGRSTIGSLASHSSVSNSDTTSKKNNSVLLPCIGNMNELKGCSAVKGHVNPDTFGGIVFDAGFQKSILDFRYSIQNDVDKGQFSFNYSEDSPPILSQPIAKCNVQDSFHGRNWVLGIQKNPGPDEGVIKKRKARFQIPKIASFRVDFGPFRIGRINLVEGTQKNESGISTKSGISLPMGVKMPYAKKEKTAVPEKFITWSSDEDKKLRNLFYKFPFNWNVISRAMSFRVESFENQELRSARQCRERWELLSKEAEINDTDSNSRDIVPSVVTDGISKSSFVTIADVETSHTNMQAPYTLLMDSSFLSNSRQERNLKHDSKSDKLKVSSGPKSIRERLCFSKTSMLKRQHVPLTIPGCSAGNIPPTLHAVPPHPSHSHSVQKAISVPSSLNGSASSRTEMWPLQVLDSLDKQMSQEENKNSTTTKQVAPASPQQRRSQQTNASNAPQHPSPNPYPQIHPQTHITQPTQQPHTNMNSVSSSAQPQNQHELVKQAARAAALAVPPNRSRAKSLGDPQLRTAPSQQALQLPPPMPAPKQHSAPVSGPPLPSLIHPQQQITTGGLPLVPQTSIPSNVKPSPIGAPYSMNPNQRNHTSPQQSSVPPTYNSQKGPPYINNTSNSRR